MKKNKIHFLRRKKYENFRNKSGKYDENIDFTKNVDKTSFQYRTYQIFLLRLKDLHLASKWSKVVGEHTSSCMYLTYKVGHY